MKEGQIEASGWSQAASGQAELKLIRGLFVPSTEKMRLEGWEGEFLLFAAPGEAVASD